MTHARAAVGPTRGARRSIVGGVDIFIYSCSQTVETIDFKIYIKISKEINCAEHGYMNIAPPPQLSIFWRPWAQRHCSVFLTTSKNVDSATYCLTYPSLNKILRFATCVYRQNVGLLKMFLKVPSAQVAFWTNQRR